MGALRQTTVLEVSGVRWASQHAAAETVLSRRPGVISVDVNPVAQNATVTYDPAVTSVVELSAWVRDCGYHCAGRSVPNHICDPMAEPPTQETPVMRGTTSTQVTGRRGLRLRRT